MRTINLTTYILAPILVGQIITFGSKILGAGFIAVWNICSGVLEYHLLTNIYKRIPELSRKNIPLIQIESPASESPDSSNQNGEPATPNSQNDEFIFDELTEVSLMTPTGVSPGIRDANGNKVYPWTGAGAKSNLQRHSCCIKTVAGLKTKLKETWLGWKDYFAHPVRNAGVGLALLYMTVLGFDSITTGSLPLTTFCFLIYIPNIYIIS